MDLDDLLLNPTDLPADKIVLLVHRVRTLEIQLASARRKEDELAALVAERNAALDHMQGHVNDLRLQVALSGAGVSYSAQNNTSEGDKSTTKKGDDDDRKLNEDDDATIRNNVDTELGPDDERSSQLYQEMCGLCVSGEHAVGNAGKFGRRGSLTKIAETRQNSQSPTTNQQQQQQQLRNNNSTGTPPSSLMSTTTNTSPNGVSMMKGGNPESSLSSFGQMTSPALTDAAATSPPPPCNFVMHSNMMMMNNSGRGNAIHSGNERIIPKQQQHPSSATVTPTRLRLLQNTRSPKIGGANGNNNNSKTDSPFSLSGRDGDGAGGSVAASTLTARSSSVIPPTPPSSMSNSDKNGNDDGNTNPRFVREFKRLRTEDESNEYS